MTPSQKLTQLLLKEGGGNVTHLAEALSKYTGRTIHRQMVQRWLNGANMTMENFTMLEGYRAFATSALKKKARDARYRAKKKMANRG